VQLVQGKCGSRCKCSGDQKQLSWLRFVQHAHTHTMTLHTHTETDTDRFTLTVTVPVQLAGRLCHLEMLRQSLQEGEVTVRQQQSTEDTHCSVEHRSVCNQRQRRDVPLGRQQRLNFTALLIKTQTDRYQVNTVGCKSTAHGP